MPALTIEKVIVFVLVFTRIGAIITTAPVLGSPSVPVRVKIGLAFIMTFVFFPFAGSYQEVVKWGQIELFFALAREILLGITVGFVSNLIFSGINLAGQLMGFQMGFAIVNVMDPLNQTQVSVISQFLGLASLILFITVNGHYWFIEAIAESFNFLRLGEANLSNFIIRDVMKAGAELFVIALKIGAPLFAIIIAINVGLGIVARTVPQMNVFIVGFPRTIGAGLIGIGVTLPIFFEVAKGLFNKMGWNVFSLLKAM
jgi:flagellar biosynthetic protein FliR